MKHIYLNLKRFDIPKELGGVNSIAPVEAWGAYIVENTKEALAKYGEDEGGSGKREQESGHRAAGDFPGRCEGRREFWRFYIQPDRKGHEGNGLFERINRSLRRAQR